MTDVTDALRRGIDRIQKQCGEITTLKAENERLRSALEMSITALDDWTASYAPDECDPDRVKEARGRIREGGTLYYIARVQRQNRQALKESPSD